MKIIQWKTCSQFLRYTLHFSHSFVLEVPYKLTAVCDQTDLKLLCYGEIIGDFAKFLFDSSQKSEK